MLSQCIIDGLEQALKQVCTASGADLPKSAAIRIEQPANIEHGDYSTNIAMQLAKHLRKSPMDIAELIKNMLIEQGSIGNLVHTIKVAAPGFINLYINWCKWADMTFELPGNKADEKVVIEHTSINPNKSAHIGHLRNACIGDTLVRLMKKAGYQVEAHNYIDDLGNQLADTVVGILHTPLAKEHARFGDYCWDIYSLTNKAYDTAPELAQKRTEVLHELEEGNGNLAWVGLLVAERIVKEHLEEMQQFGIDYDLLVWESSIVREGFWSSAFEQLKSTPNFYEEQTGKLAGCWVLKQDAEGEADSPESEFSLEKVLVRSNGILTYTAKDIAYHLWKFGLITKDFVYQKFTGDVWSTGRHGEQHRFGKADIVINVIDYRQQYPQAMVKQALESLGYTEQAKKLHHVSYGVVSLSPSAASDLGIDISDGRASYAMSGRQGIGIKIADLIDQMEHVIETSRSNKNGLSSREIAIASIRYYLLRFALQTEVVFDMKQASEISGNTGVYLLYSYARSLSVLNKAQESGISPVMPEAFPELEQAEHALLRHISTWQDTLHTASRELAPNILCNFAYELASLFNNFYAACPILKAEGGVLHFRLWLTSRFKDTLGEALDVLGLPTPSRM